MAKKQPSSVDAHVGSRVRLRRMLIGMSQQNLGELLGLTFQQVQKYEKGANRIAATRLVAVARALSVPLEFLLGQTERPDVHGPQATVHNRF